MRPTPKACLNEWTGVAFMELIVAYGMVRNKPYMPDDRAAGGAVGADQAGLMFVEFRTQPDSYL